MFRLENLFLTNIPFINRNFLRSIVIWKKFGRRTPEENFRLRQSVHRGIARTTQLSRVFSWCSKETLNLFKFIQTYSNCFKMIGFLNNSSWQIKLFKRPTCQASVTRLTNWRDYSQLLYVTMVFLVYAQLIRLTGDCQVGSSTEVTCYCTLSRILSGTF